MSVFAEFAGRKFSSPVFTAAGTFGWGVEAFAGDYFPRGLGAFVSKGFSVVARRGNANPRIFEGDGYIANSIGLQNPGLHYVCEHYLPFYERETKFPNYFLNLLANSTEDFVTLIDTVLARQPSTKFCGFELNLSCPNVKRGGAEFLSDFASLRNLLQTLAPHNERVPLVLKLGSSLAAGEEFAALLRDLNYRYVSVGNTLAVAPRLDGVPALANRVGGLSGPPLRPLQLLLIDRLLKLLPNLEVCAIGGVSTAEHVREYLSAGARVVQVGTAQLANPWITQELVLALSKQ